MTAVVKAGEKKFQFLSVKCFILYNCGAKKKNLPGCVFYSPPSGSSAPPVPTRSGSLPPSASHPSSALSDRCRPPRPRLSHSHGSALHGPGRRLIRGGRHKGHRTYGPYGSNTTAVVTSPSNMENGDGFFLVWFFFPLFLPSFFLWLFYLFGQGRAGTRRSREDPPHRARLEPRSGGGRLALISPSNVSQRRTSSTVATLHKIASHFCSHSFFLFS